MPLYEFYCSQCQKKYEELCSSLVEQIDCPECSNKANKVFSAFQMGRSSTGSGTAPSSCGG